VCDSAATVEAAISSFADIGADELIFNPGTDDPEDVARLAEIALTERAVADGATITRCASFVVTVAGVCRRDRRGPCRV
jgi:hypothetical protein